MDAWGAFHFLRPWWLVVAVPPLVLALLSLRRRKTSDQWQGAIAPHLLEHLVTRRSSSQWLSPEVMLAPFGLVLAVAMAGPAYRLADTPQSPDDTTLLVIVDLSSSMAGQDIGPSRAGRVRLKLRDLFDLRRGGRIGLIAVAGSAHVVMPPTDDVDALVPYVDVLDPKLMPSDGENFAAAASLVPPLVKAEKGPAVVLVAADSIPPDGAQALAKLSGPRLSLIGWAVGTEGGRPAEGVPGLDRTGFDRMERAGAQVVDLTLSGSDLRQINTLLERARTASIDPDDASLWEDSGYALVVLFALGVLFWFRRGWVIGRTTAALLAMFLCSGCADPEGDGSWWLDLWLTPDQQGQRLFDAGEYKAAARRFDDPMWKGIAYYTAHDWKDAQAQFGRIDSVVGLFNLADAHAQAGEIASAIAVYDQVLKKQPTHRAARKNRDYFVWVLKGLEQTSDFDYLKKPSGQQPDPTHAQFRKEQLQGPRDKASEARDTRDKSNKGHALSKAESDQWMQRVSTTPADFLRSKFSMQEARGKQP